MNNRVLLLALILLSAASARAQFGSFGDIPIELTAGETRFVGGVAVAEKNVIIHHGASSIFADYVEYNPETRDVLAIGNVRVYRDGRMVEGDRILYNLETKLLRTSDFRTSVYPFFAKGETINSLEDGTGYEGTNTIITTSDSSKPDYQVKVGNARFYPNDHITLSDVTISVGTTPIFWFPYLYQSLKEETGFTIMPGYSKDWGVYMLTRYSIPITDTTHGILSLDLRSSRGVALGLETKSKFGPDNKSWAHFQGYYAEDSNTNINNTAETLLPVSSARYRLSLQSRTYFSDDLYANADINKLSDYRFLRDFFPSEYHNNPQPDNMLSLTKWDENYTLTGIFRAHFNNFFDTTERLPEVALDITRHPIFNAPLVNFPVFYEGESGIAFLARDFGNMSNTDVLNPVITSSLLKNYDALRIDSFHQFSLPQTYGGWLSVIPSIGLRGTYYSSGANSVITTLQQNSGLDLKQNAQSLLQSQSNSPVFRPVFNANLESSFKYSREWEDIQSRTWGVDGLRHVVQPYTDLSFVRTGQNPENILQFDRLTPNTQLPSITFPQFTTLDSIPNWSIWRFGVRNTLQTRRDDTTYNVVEMNTFFNANLEAPAYPGLPKEGAFSNLCNKLVYAPFSWAALSMDMQFPLVSTGFTEVNTGVHFLVNEDLRLNIGHLFLSSNPYFLDSKNVSLGAYYRINDNWGFSFTDQYEFSDKSMQMQDYSLHRDLSSWIVSFGLTVRENRNTITNQTVSDVGVVLTFTLKDLPTLRLPVSVRPSVQNF